MFYNRTGVRVRVSGGLKEFDGKKGEIVGTEGNYYRVKFDKPVMVDGAEVHDDLWMADAGLELIGPEDDEEDDETDEGQQWHADSLAE